VRRAHQDVLRDEKKVVWVPAEMARAECHEQVATRPIASVGVLDKDVKSSKRGGAM
jgi:hypothetical protein